jgi:hypothetical protein
MTLKPLARATFISSNPLGRVAHLRITPLQVPKIPGGCFMRNIRALLQVWCVLLVLLGITPATFAAQTPVHVFYLATGNTITTYAVNPATLVPTKVGTPLVISGAPFIGLITPAPNDHFIYVQWPDANYNSSLSVYATDASGVPQSPAVQTLPAPGWQFMLHPSGKFAYVMIGTSGSQGYTETLYLYHVDANTGVLTQDPKIQGTYGPDFFWGESLVGFNRAGTRLFDDWSVSFDHENNYNYSMRPVNTTTGQLAPDVGTIFAPSNFDGLDEQFFGDNYILNLHNDGNGLPSVLNVYPAVKNPPQPLFTCTQSMLNACGAAFNYWVSVDQKYVFLPETTDIAIGRIDTGNKRIVQTGSIPGNVYLYFSPEDKGIYAVDSSSGVVQVYLFNSTNGTVTPGGTTAFNAVNGYFLAPAVRQ